MQVLTVEPLKAPYLSEIGSELEDLQKAVGGYIELVYPFEDEVCIVCNDEGKYNGSELNRSLRDEDGEIYDVVAGTFLIVGLGEENLESIPEELIPKYMEMYAVPELFTMKDGNVISIPLDIKTGEPVEQNEYEETRGNLKLIIRKDIDPISPRDFENDNLGTMVTFDPFVRGDNNGCLKTEDFFVERLTVQLGSEEEAKEFFNELTDKCQSLVPGFADEYLRDTILVDQLKKDNVILPVYLCRNHEGQAVSVEPFADKENTGQIGWIYADKALVSEKYGAWTAEARKQAEEALTQEVETYSDYLQDKNYEYDIYDKNTGEVLDGGFWTGDIESLKAYAWNNTDHLQKKAQEKAGDTR